MSDDQEFNFTPPPRRERKEFEPPPWEDHEYAPPIRREHQEQPADETLGTPETRDKVPDEVDGSIGVGGLTPTAALKPDATSQALSESHVIAMLYQLKAEDPPLTKGLSRLSMAAGFVLIGLGVVFMIWAAAMISISSRSSEQGGTGILFGLTVMTLGVGFAGVGAWFVFRSLRHQGVL